MADPIDFEGANVLLVGAPGDDGARPLPVCRGDGAVVSCWQLSVRDLREIVETGVVWVSVVGGTAPPVLVSGRRDEVLTLVPTEEIA